MNDMLSDILRQVSGSIDEAACEELRSLVKGLPNNAVILDLYPGAGRSTVVLATALREFGKTEAKVWSVDTHIQNPRSDRAFEEGSFSEFRTSIRTFKCAQWVVPVLANPDAMKSILSKKSVNLVLAQYAWDGDAKPIADLAAHTLRAGGKYVVAGIVRADIILPSAFKRSSHYSHLMVFDV